MADSKIESAKKLLASGILLNLIGYRRRTPAERVQLAATSRKTIA